MKNQVGSTRMDTALKMALIAFISLLAFSSGVYFGKQITESDYQLKALESDFNKNRASDVADHEDGVSEDDVNAISEKLVNGEKATGHGDAEAVADTNAGEGRNVASSAHAAPTNEHAAEHAEESEGHAPAAAAPAAGHGAAAGHAAPAAGHGAAPAASHAAPQADAHAKPAPKAAPAKSATNAANSKPDLSLATKAAQRVANNAAPVDAHAPGAAASAKTETARVPSSLPRTVGTSQDVEFTVQVASYPTMEAAKDHASELVKKGFPAFPVEAAVNGKVWFRVSVGSFRSQREATTYRAQLLRQTSLPSAIVQKITR